MATKKKSTKKTKLEKQYEELFKPITTQPYVPDTSSLAQPSPHENVMGLVTHGAYEEPILG